MGAPALLSCSLSFLWQSTSGGSSSRQRMHIGGLPTLHHWLAQDLQVRVCRVIGRGGRAPRGAAVLAGREERAGCRRAHGEAVHTRPGAQGSGAAGLEEAEWGRCLCREEISLALGWVGAWGVGGAYPLGRGLAGLGWIRSLEEGWALLWEEGSPLVLGWAWVAGV